MHIQWWICILYQGRLQDVFIPGTITGLPLSIAGYSGEGRGVESDIFQCFSTISDSVYTLKILHRGKPYVCVFCPSIAGVGNSSPQYYVCSMSIHTKCNLPKNLYTFLEYFITLYAMCVCVYHFFVYLDYLIICLICTCISFFLLEWPKVPVQETGPPPVGVFGEGKEGMYILGNNDPIYYG